MKKLIIRLLIGLAVLFILVIVGVGLFLNGAIKRGVETVGPMVTKVDIKLDSVNLSLLSGSGRIKGLLVGNPEGFKSPTAIKVGDASLAVEPGSLLSDKIVVKSVNVQGPEITFETDFKRNNLNQILANVEAFSGGEKASAQPAENQPAETKPAKAPKKFEVDEFVITGGKVNVTLTSLGGKSVTVPLPEIHLTDLGKGPEGITAAELTKKVLEAIEKGAISVSGNAVSDLGKQAGELTKGLGGAQSNAVESVTRGLGGLFKKK
jgi:uncharacterized protein involved in outer membrane biogenesis